MNIKKIVVRGFIGGAVVAGALSFGAGTAAADFAAPGEVNSRIATLTGGDGATTGLIDPGALSSRQSASITSANDSGLMSSISAGVIESDKAVPVVFAWPTWDAPNIGGVGIETSAGLLEMADSQALSD